MPFASLRHHCARPYRLSCEALARQCLARIEACEPEIRAWTHCEPNTIRSTRTSKAVSRNTNGGCAARAGSPTSSSPKPSSILTLLLLSGPQTPGEIRSRAGRFSEVAARELVDEDNLDNSLLVELPRMKGRKDAEFMHQLCGAVDLDAYAETAAASSGGFADKERIAELERRVAELEAENADLRDQPDARGNT
ncbi:DUF480 domain-containing protein [Salinisphaera sp. SWV1]|uniref:DUF480 domain-containing protein n=1 Tax=Salinisphaera sp. SWV1 TaxID=3454139 RepID=UPI003F8605D7